jgi:glucan-binding YG repeat protein
MDHLGGTKTDMTAGLYLLKASGITINTMYLPDKTIAPYSQTYPARYSALERFMQDQGTGSIVYLSLNNNIVLGDAVGTVIGPVDNLQLYPSQFPDDDGVISSNSYTLYENNCSLAIIFTCGNTTYFTCGDAYEPEATSLVTHYGANLQCDIMKLNYHGTGSGNSTALLKNIQPRYSFASNTSFTDKRSTTGQWETYFATSRATKYGMCYLVGSEQETIIYHIKDDVITLYQGSTVTKANKMTGWQHLYGADGKYMDYSTYYLDSDTEPETGVTEIDGQYYHFDSTGLMLYGSFSADGTYDGWVTNSTGSRYYQLSSDRKFAYLFVGFHKLDGEYYYFSKNGYLKTGDVDEDNGETVSIETIGNYEYAIDKDGHITRSQWLHIDDYDYYFNKSGQMLAEGIHKIGDSYYLFDDDGTLLCSDSETERQRIWYDDHYYLVDSNGIITRSKFVTIGSQKYYFNKRGIMIEDQIITINGSRYYFNSNGHMIKDRAYKVGNYKYYFNANGKMRINKTVVWKNVKYKCQSNGVMKKVKVK